MRVCLSDLFPVTLLPRSGAANRNNGEAYAGKKKDDVPDPASCGVEHHRQLHQASGDGGLTLLDL